MTDHEETRHPRDAAMDDDAPGQESTGPGPGGGRSSGPRDTGTAERPGGAGGSEGGARDRTGSERRHGHRSWGDTLSDVQDTVGEMVGEVMEGVREVAAGRRFPRLDVYRVPGEGYRVLVDLPGVSRDDLEVTTMGGELTVSGQRPEPDLPEGSEPVRSERGHGRFNRTLRLPPDAREAEVRASLEDGVLTIRVPRVTPGDAQRVEID